PLGRRGDHGVEGRAPSSRRFLHDVADAHARRHFNRAIAGFIDPGDELQQARLAGPITRPTRALGGSAAQARSRMMWPPRRSVMPSIVSMGADLTATRVPAAQTIFCPSIRRLSADVNAATRKPARFREKNKIGRDAFNPRPRANESRRGYQ